MPIHYFYGEDTYAAREAIGEIARNEQAKVCWLDEEDLVERGAGQLLAQGGGSLFGGEVIVVRDPSAMTVGIQDDLISALKMSRGGLQVLWDRGEPKKSLSVYKEFSKQGKRFIVPSISDLCIWLVELAKNKKVELTPGAARVLVDRVGADRWELASELEKLALLYDKVAETEAKGAVPASVQAEIFSVLDALGRGEQSRAVAGIKNLLEEGNGEFYILSMLAYQFRVLFMVRMGIDQGKKQFEIVKQSGIKQYSVQKNWEAAKRRPSSFWRGAQTRVLAMDFAIRQGKVDARTGVLMLVVGLA